MKKVMLVLFILCMTLPVFGNDGVYNTRGGVITDKGVGLTTPTKY